jgi:hypothetical protein
MELENLYQQMAELTLPICANKCKNRFTCCNIVHCEAAEKYAKERYGITLNRTGNQDLPFMGQHGCVVPPHLRPRCTMHTCMVAQLGFQPYDSAWNDKYLRLRTKIETLEKQSCPAS